jgi:hypothetical protein
MDHKGDTKLHIVIQKHECECRVHKEQNFMHHHVWCYAWCLIISIYFFTPIMSVSCFDYCIYFCVKLSFVVWWVVVFLNTSGKRRTLNMIRSCMAFNVLNDRKKYAIENPWCWMLMSRNNGGRNALLLSINQVVGCITLNTTSMMMASKMSLTIFWMWKILEWSLALEISMKSQRHCITTHLFWKCKIVYAQLVTQKSRDDKPNINAFLNVVLSIEASPPTHYISKTIGINKYLLSKAIPWKIHVNMISKNTCRGLPQINVF